MERCEAEWWSLHPRSARLLSSLHRMIGQTTLPYPAPWGFMGPDPTWKFFYFILICHTPPHTNKIFCIKHVSLI